VHRWVEHTGELELAIEAPTEREVFEDAFDAMSELLSVPATGEVAARTIELSAPDRPALLADWLAELAFLAESEGVVPERLLSLELGDFDLRAGVEGRRGDPPQLVKGVTYHRLALEPTAGGFRASVVLDV
jgi:SHS2 domain-containing protein